MCKPIGKTLPQKVSYLYPTMTTAELKSIGKLTCSWILSQIWKPNCCLKIFSEKLNYDKALKLKAIMMQKLSVERQARAITGSRNCPVSQNRSQNFQTWETLMWPINILQSTITQVLDINLSRVFSWLKKKFFNL